MTAAEYRRLAARKSARATTLIADAARLRSHASALRGLLDPLVPTSRRVWAGPAAEDFEAGVHAHRVVLEEQVQRLVTIAADLEREADSDRRAAAGLQVKAAAAEMAERATTMAAGVV